LYQVLETRGLKPVLWPDLDAYDLHVEVGAGPRKTTFRVDVKDYSNPLLLAKKVQADGGDAGGARWLVVPDFRASSVPLLTSVCREFGLSVATAGEIGAQICQAGGVPWA
jgi:REase associating with pPIWI_RE